MIRIRRKSLAGKARLSLRGSFYLLRFTGEKGIPWLSRSANSRSTEFEPWNDTADTSEVIGRNSELFLQSEFRCSSIFDKRESNSILSVGRFSVTFMKFHFSTLLSVQFTKSARFCEFQGNVPLSLSLSFCFTLEIVNGQC